LEHYRREIYAADEGWPREINTDGENSMYTCLVLALALFVQVKETEEGPIPKEKWKSDYTEKTWGLKIKTVKYTTNQSPPDVNVILEFTKDLTPEEVKTCKAALDRKEGALEFCFFDEDGVIFTKATYKNYVVLGDISGRKGDAIRCRMSIIRDGPLQFMTSRELARKVMKVEFRLPPPK
jgi:hypothetical protein